MGFRKIWIGTNSFNMFIHLIALSYSFLGMTAVGHSCCGTLRSQFSGSRKAISYRISTDRFCNLSYVFFLRTTLIIGMSRAYGSMDESLKVENPVSMAGPVCVLECGRAIYAPYIQN